MLPAEKCPKPCTLLRAKRAYGEIKSDTEPSWNSGLLATDCYWCLQTMEAWGPDDQPALPGSCTSDRSCFEGVPSPESLPVA